MAVSLTACSNNAGTNNESKTPSASESTQEASQVTTPQETTQTPEVKSEASVNFEDGQMGFVEV